jgi:hypothetical protein
MVVSRKLGDCEKKTPAETEMVQPVKVARSERAGRGVDYDACLRKPPNLECSRMQPAMPLCRSFSE